MDFEDQLASAMRSSVDTLSAPVADLVAGGLARGRRLRRRRRLVGGGASAVALLLLVVGLGAVALRDGPTSSTTAAGPATCRSVVRTGVLPAWARAGFSDSRPAVPHVLSSRGDVVAILFGRALHSPPSAEVNNKILWVSRVASNTPADLRIDAVRAGTTTHVRRAVPGGPGPSTIDLPQPGCWHLELRWGAHRDSIDLDYVRP